MSRLVRVMTVTAGALALMGCAGPTATSSPAKPDRPQWTAAPVTIGEARVIRTDAEISLPLDPYVPSGQHDELIDRAKHVLTARCMARFGLNWSTLSASTAENRPRHLGRYGVFDAKAAAEHGYVGPARKLGPGPADRQLSGDERDALGGCQGEATRELGEQPAAEAELLGLLQKQATWYAEQDHRLRAGFKLWSACMARGGFDYPQPWAANDQSRWKDPRNRDEQILTAATDVACKLEVNLVGLWVAVESAYQLRLMQPLGEALASARQRLEKQLQIALTVVQ